MSDPARRQLDALARVDERFGEAGIDYWLFGGWAVDFHAGAITRVHDDVDVAVWFGELGRITELLEEDGWRHAPYPDEDGGTGYERDSVRLELTFLVRRDDGGAYIPLRHGDVSWPDEAPPGSVIGLLGTQARVVGLAALAEMKSSRRADPADAEKDRADHEALLGIVQA